MSHRILITGGSGYLGGSLLSRLQEANLPPYEKLYALVRNDAQAEGVKQYGAEPIIFDSRDEAAVRQSIVSNGIDIVFFLIDALTSDMQPHFIKALAEVKKATGQEVHFLHTTGAKIFSSHAGAPADRPLLDTDPELYNIQKSQQPHIPLMQSAIDANNATIEVAKQYGVRSYIFAPCIVYGRGEGFGKKISIQTVAIVQAAIGAKRVYKVDEGRPTWPVCHVVDNSTYYIQLLRRILAGESIGYGKNGYYLASPGSVAWEDLYQTMAASLEKRGVVADSTVVSADEAALEAMGAGMGVPKEYVALQLGGSCSFTPAHAKEIGWTPQFTPEHILETADLEVEVILEALQQK